MRQEVDVGCLQFVTDLDCPTQFYSLSVKFLLGKYMHKKNGNVQHSYINQSEQSHVEVPTEFFAASVNSCIMRN